MWMVKVRILPPQPIFPFRIAAKLASARFNTDSSIENPMFPNDAVSTREGRHFMGRTAEVSLYRLIKVGGTHRYVRIVKSGRGWVPKTELVGKLGAYYLRYLKKGSRTFESVGDDIHVALQEQKARQ
jgi:hypothetical protein